MSYVKLPPAWSGFGATPSVASTMPSADQLIFDVVKDVSADKDLYSSLSVPAKATINTMSAALVNSLGKPLSELPMGSEIASNLLKPAVDMAQDAVMEVLGDAATEVATEVIGAAAVAAAAEYIPVIGAVVKVFIAFVSEIVEIENAKIENLKKSKEFAKDACAGSMIGLNATGEGDEPRPSDFFSVNPHEEEHQKDYSKNWPQVGKALIAMTEYIPYYKGHDPHAGYAAVWVHGFWLAAQEALEKKFPDIDDYKAKQTVKNPVYQHIFDNSLLYVACFDPKIVGADQAKKLYKAASLADSVSQGHYRKGGYGKRVGVWIGHKIIFQKLRYAMQQQRMVKPAERANRSLWTIYMDLLSYQIKTGALDAKYASAIYARMIQNDPFFQGGEGHCFTYSTSTDSVAGGVTPTKGLEFVMRPLTTMYDMVKAWKSDIDEAKIPENAAKVAGDIAYALTGGKRSINGASLKKHLASLVEKKRAEKAAALAKAKQKVLAAKVAGAKAAAPGKAVAMILVGTVLAGGTIWYLKKRKDKRKNGWAKNT